MPSRLRQRFRETGARADPWVTNAAYEAVHAQQVRVQEDPSDEAAAAEADRDARRAKRRGKHQH